MMPHFIKWQTIKDILQMSQHNIEINFCNCPLIVASFISHHDFQKAVFLLYRQHLQVGWFFTQIPYDVRELRHFFLFPINVFHSKMELMVRELLQSCNQLLALSFPYLLVKRSIIKMSHRLIFLFVLARWGYHLALSHSLIKRRVKVLQLLTFEVLARPIVYFSPKPIIHP